MQPRGKGEHILYAICPSVLGQMLVARTATGLCAVALADTEEELLRELRGRYPSAARLEQRPDALQGERETILNHVQGSHDLYGLRWDLPCTDFQSAAWRAMQRIPSGGTLTYQQLAAELGCPQGQVAVGQACARNPLALVIPCHRVLASGNRPHHWRWGLQRKIALLQMERNATATVEPTQPSFQAELF